MIKLFKSISLIINYKTILVTLLAVISSNLCFRYGLIAKFPDMLVGVAVVFPVVFSISSAYSRRETALQRYPYFKGHAVATYYATRDWTADRNNELPQKMRTLVHDMINTMRIVFHSEHQKEWVENEKTMYLVFPKLSALTMEMRAMGVQSGEISRISQYVSKMIIAFDNMRMIHTYRTPVTLRSYSKVFIYIFPIIYGPYFASTFNDYAAQLEYVMPVLYSFILVSLDNIQDHLENPFDEVGEDDIRLEPEEVSGLLS